MFPRIALGSLASLLVLAAATSAPAAVNVNIGIAVPAPPRLVAVPGTPVAYAPAVPGNYFVYAGRYYVFANGTWYASRGYNGPWLVLSPGHVPRSLLAVPVQYYRVRPQTWAHWGRDVPPRWDAKWGRGGHDQPPHDAAQRGHEDREHHAEKKHQASHRDDHR
jgi:hypothetical protein